MKLLPAIQFLMNIMMTMKPEETKTCKHENKFFIGINNRHIVHVIKITRFNGDKIYEMREPQNMQCRNLLSFSINFDY